MKSLVILVAAATVAVAQYDSLPTCGQVCMTNMDDIAVNDFNCTRGDVLCYCQKINYGYGVRDCANEACTSSSDAAAVISYGTNYCASALSTASLSSPTAPGYSILSSAAGIGGSGARPTATGTAGKQSGAGGSSNGLLIPISTVTGQEIFTSGSVVVTSTGPVSTIFSTPTGSAASSLKSVASKASGSVGSKISGAESSASATGSAIETGAATATGTATGSTAGAPIATAAPLLGAGVMAVLLAAL